MGKVVLVQSSDGKHTLLDDTTDFEAELRRGHKELLCDVCHSPIAHGKMYMGIFGDVGHQRCIQKQEKKQMAEICADDSDEE